MLISTTLVIWTDLFYTQLFKLFQVRPLPYVCLVIVSLLTVAVAIEGRPLCSWETEFTIIYPNGTFMGCRKCPKCAVGHGLPFECGEKVSVGTSTDCRPCEANTFSDTNDSSTCIPCDYCRLGFMVLRECNRTQNRLCDFSCQPNYYLDTMVDPSECKECFFCCPHVTDSERLKQCKNMPRNQQCERNYKNEQCKLFATAESTTPVSTGPLALRATCKPMNMTLEDPHVVSSCEGRSAPPSEDESRGTSSSSIYKVNNENTIIYCISSALACLSLTV